MKAAPAVWAGLTLDRPHTMGILNVTPDSFSDGGAYGSAETAIAAGLAMDYSLSVQDVPYPDLREKLLAARQIVDLSQVPAQKSKAAPKKHVP